MNSKSPTTKNQTVSAVSRASSNGTISILGVRLAAVNRNQLNEKLSQFLDRNQNGWLSYINVHALNLAQNSQALKSFFDNALLNYCDGSGVMLGAWILGKPLPEKIALTDWINDVAFVCANEKKSMFLLGSTDDSVTAAATELVRQNPQLNIAGVHNGYFDFQNDYDVREQIIKSKADLLLVGMGMPLQEEWIARVSKEFSRMIVLNAGSCFDYVSGRRKRAPKWMQRSGLEWLFRLMTEPRRLWRRYLLGNPLYLFRILRLRLFG